MAITKETKGLKTKTDAKSGYERKLVISTIAIQTSFDISVVKRWYMKQWGISKAELELAHGC